MIRQAHVFIYGDVTGVGFRFWTVRNAKQLGLTGWVRNIREGLVDAVFAGEEEKINTMIEKCKKGPEVSWVEKVEVDWQEAKNEFTDFEIKY